MSNNNKVADGGPSQGTYIQLASKGSEDVHIYRQPEITFFKSMYKKHTPFAIESIRNVFIERPQFNGTANVIIKKDYDLINKMYLTVDLPYDESLTDTYWTNRVGFNLLKKYELYIGRFLIQKQYGRWVHIWKELTATIDEKRLLDEMVGTTYTNGYTNGPGANKLVKLTIPILFFCDNYELSIPLLKIYNGNDIKIKFFFEKKANCIQSGSLPSGDLSNAYLWVDYVCLSNEERKEILNSDYRIVFNSVQFYERSLLGSGMKSIILPFTNNSKELFWVVRNTKTLYDKFTDYTDGNGGSMIKSVQFKLNTKKMYSSKPRTFDYFNYIQPYQFHSGCPDLGINIHSFCLEPESNKPSGDLNLKTISRFVMDIDVKQYGHLYIYSSMYNVIDFIDGDVELFYRV